MAELSQICRFCQFYQVTKIPKAYKNESGICRLNPPSVFDSEGIPTTCWPGVSKDDWCGKYQPIL